MATVTEKQSKEKLGSNPEKNKQKLLLESRLRPAEKLALRIHEAGGRALVVGGWVRDEMRRRLGQTIDEPKDIDVEIYGIPASKLLTILEEFGSTKKTGASFEVIKVIIDDQEVDVSIPRRETSTGEGHGDFLIEGDHTMTSKEAARRRDFTINAMSIDPLTGEIIDEYGGIEDLKNRILRATDFKKFGEDPLRVLRLVRFAVRFGYSVEEKTFELARTIPLKKLATERIANEWKRILLESSKPSIGLEWARRLLVIEKLHPELHALIGVPQEPEWHPEGDVWTHTHMVADAAADIIRREKLGYDQALIIMLSSLLHDVGKADTTAYQPNKKGDLAWRSLEHSEAGVKPAAAFLSRLRFPDIDAKVLTSKILPLIREHLWPGLNPNPTDKAVRRLAKRLQPASIYELVMVAEADHRGRALPWHGYPPAAALLAQAQRLRVEYEPPKRLVTGNPLLERGYKSGKHIGEALEYAYDAQLAGTITTHEEALALAIEHLTKNGQTPSGV